MSMWLMITANKSLGWTPFEINCSSTASPIGRVGLLVKYKGKVIVEIGCFLTLESQPASTKIRFPDG